MVGLSQARSFRSAEEYSDDDYSDDEEVQSPIDDVDPFIFFVYTVKVLQVLDPTRYLIFMLALDSHHQAYGCG
ncbi:hypothetical protein MKW98_019866 [Papaver atlanticum]|uniref:Uncharacterized protein n=1 Tax=Papaver atlanticum TaxID=357466 RepID=A0AAD4X7A1_9MAGN|nr:hypothetical protein MKW98_019866 [Papaver atlanticum]